MPRKNPRAFSGGDSGCMGRHAKPRSFDFVFDGGDGSMSKGDGHESKGDARVARTVEIDIGIGAKARVDRGHCGFVQISGIKTHK